MSRGALTAPLGRAARPDAHLRPAARPSGLRQWALFRRKQWPFEASGTSCLQARKRWRSQCRASGCVVAMRGDSGGRGAGGERHKRKPCTACQLSHPPPPPGETAGARSESPASLVPTARLPVDLYPPPCPPNSIKPIRLSESRAKSLTAAGPARGRRGGRVTSLPRCKAPEGRRPPPEHKLHVSMTTFGLVSGLLCFRDLDRRTSVA